MTKETQNLIEAVKFFAWSAENKCFPTTKRWTIKEAKEYLGAIAKIAENAEKQTS